MSHATVQVSHGMQAFGPGTMASFQIRASIPNRLKHAPGLTVTLFSLPATIVLYIVISVYFSPSAAYFPSFYIVCRSQRQEILYKARLLWDVFSVRVIKGHLYSEWLWYEEQDLSLKKVLGSGTGSTTSVIGLLDNILKAKLSYMKTENFPASFWEPLQGSKEENYLAMILDILVNVYGYGQNGSS